MEKALYTPATIVMCYRPILKDFTARLKKAGKSNMLITVTIMRNLLHITCGMLMLGKSFDANYAVNNA